MKKDCYLAGMQEEYEQLIGKAREIALEVLKDETRSDGSPFIGHPDAVARIVREEICLSDDCIVAIYLHEATREHPDLDISMFPDSILTMVRGLNNIAGIKPKDTRLEAEKYKKLIVKYSDDPRVVIIKIADRLEIMRSLNIFPKSSREPRLLETLLLYIPLAHQLGLHNVKSELENIYFRYAEPEQFRAITNKLKATEKDREKLTREFIRPLEDKLKAEGISYKLKVRTKTAYSIFKKMQKQGVGFDGVFDVFAIRFIIDCEEDKKAEQDICWKVYSYVTEEYEPDTSRLRDWLTTPKPNGYESLHITVKNAEGNCIEVQIRTKRMDDIAENGPAAHWSYKGVRSDETMKNWLLSVRYNLEHTSQMKAEDIPLPPSNEIFVFTPSGELRILSEGASVLDFAFNIHSSIGSHCTGGRINGKAVSIREKLQTGDVVEIITSKNQKPSSDWLNWVVTSKARTRIKLELNEVERKKAAEGRELLSRRLKNWKLEFPDDMQADFMRKHNFNSVISFMAAIADCSVDINDIKSFILEKSEGTAKPQEQEEKKVWTGIRTSGTDDILVLNAKNVKGLEYKMARCCNPVFGDEVFGFVSRTDGIKIHRISCPNAARLIEKYPYRIQKVVWQENASGEFRCSFGITTHMEQSVIGSIMDVIGQFKASVRGFTVKENMRHGTYEINVNLLVFSSAEIDKITSQLSTMRNIIKVKRL